MTRASVLDCGSPLPLSGRRAAEIAPHALAFGHAPQSARGLAHSKTWRKHRRLLTRASVLIGSGAEDCASAPSHTTGRAVFRIRRLNAAAQLHGAARSDGISGSRTLLSVLSRAEPHSSPPRSHHAKRRHRRGDAWPAGSWPQLPRPAASEDSSVCGSSFSWSFVLSFFGPSLIRLSPDLFATTTSADFRPSLKDRISLGQC